MDRYLLAFLLIACAGCLDFGSDAQTANPTEEQILFCLSAMHILDSADIEPLGFKILGSGIDAAVWFKFQTGESDISAIFDEQFIPLDSLQGDVSFYTPDDMPQWWDTRNRLFTGGTVSLEAGVWMTVGFQQEPGYTIFYVFWHET